MSKGRASELFQRATTATGPSGELIDTSLFAGRGVVNPNLAPLNKYDEGLTPFHSPEAQNAIRESNQGVWSALANGLVQSATQVGLGTLEGVGYLLDLPQYADIITNGEREFGNWFSDIMRNAQEDVREGMPVYGGDQVFAPWSGKWWAKNLPTLATTLSLIVPAASAVKALGTAGKLLGAGRAVNALNKTRAAAKVATTALKGITGAVASRYMESTMEAAEVMQSRVEELLQQGYSQEQAAETAGKDAANTFYANQLMLLTDIPQYIMLFKGFDAIKALVGGVPKAGSKKFLKELAGQAVSEGFEEGYQYGAGKAGVGSSGVGETLTKMMDQAPEYFQDKEFWHSVVMGAFGGGVFHTLGAALNNKINKVNSNLQNIQQLVEQGRTHEARAALDDARVDAVGDPDTERLQAMAPPEEAARMQEIADDLAAETAVRSNDPNGPEKAKTIVKAKAAGKAAREAKAEMNTGFLPDEEGTVIATFSAGTLDEELAKANEEINAAFKKAGEAKPVKTPIEKRHDLFKVQLSHIAELTEQYKDNPDALKILEELEKEYRTIATKEGNRDLSKDPDKARKENAAGQGTRLDFFNRLGIKKANTPVTPQGQQKYEEQAAKDIAVEEKKKVTQFLTAPKKPSQMLDFAGTLTTQEAKDEVQKAYDAQYEKEKKNAVRLLNSAAVGASAVPLTFEEFLQEEIKGRPFLEADLERTRADLKKEWNKYQFSRKPEIEDEGDMAELLPGVAPGKDPWEEADRIDKYESAQEFLAEQEEPTDAAYWDSLASDERSTPVHKETAALTQKPPVEIAPDIPVIEKPEEAEEQRVVISPENTGSFTLLTRDVKLAKTNKGYVLALKEGEVENDPFLEDKLTPNFANAQETRDFIREFYKEGDPDVYFILDRNVNWNKSGKAALENAVVHAAVFKNGKWYSLGILKSLTRDKLTKSEIDNISQIRTELWNNPAELAVSSGSSKVKEVFNGTFNQTAQRNNLTEYQAYIDAGHSSSLPNNTIYLAVANQMGELIHGGLPDDVSAKVVPSSYLRPGLAYILVVGPDGKYHWHRVFTRDVDEHPDAINRLRELLSLAERASVEVITATKARGIDPTGRGKSKSRSDWQFLEDMHKPENANKFPNLHEWKKHWSETKVAVQTWVRWRREKKDGIFELEPDFNEFLPFILTYMGEDSIFSIDKWLAINAIAKRPIQVEAHKLNVGDYNKSIADRVYTNLGMRHAFVTPGFALTDYAPSKSEAKEAATPSREVPTVPEEKKTEHTPIAFTQTNKKGVVFTYRKTETVSPEEGARTITFDFHRSDKAEDQWNTATVPIEQTELADYDIIDEAGTLSEGDIESVNVRKITLHEDGVKGAVVVVVKINGQNVENIYPIKKKAASEKKDTTQRRKKGGFKPRLADQVTEATIDVDRAVEWLKKRLPADISIEVVNGLIRLGQVDAWGVTSNALIKLSNIAAPGTEYWEAFRVVFGNLLTEPQQKSLLEEAKKLYPESTDLERDLAREFMNYVQTKKNLPYKIKRFFKRILEFFRLLPQRKQIERIFRNIEKGGFSKAPVVSEILEPKFRRIDGLSATQVRSAVNVILDILEDIRIQLNKDYKRSLSIKLEDNDVLSTTKEFSVLGDLKYHYLDNKNEPSFNKENFWKIIRGLRPDIEGINEETEQFIFNDNPAIPGPLYLETLRGLSERGFKIRFNTGEVLEESSPVGDLDVERDENQEEREWWAIAEVSVSPKEKLTPELKRWLSTIPVRRIDDKGEVYYEGDDLGLGFNKYYSPNEVYPILQRELGNSVSTEEMLEKALTHEQPFIREIGETIANDINKATAIFKHMGQKEHPEFKLVHVTSEFEGEDKGRKVSWKLFDSNSFQLRKTIMNDLFDSFDEKNADKAHKILSGEEGLRNKKVLNDKEFPVERLRNAFSFIGFNIPGEVFRHITPSKAFWLATKLNNALRSIYIGKKEFSVAFDAFVNEIRPLYPQNYQDTHFSVEGKKVYEWINSTFFGRLLNRDRVDFISHFTRDPLYNNLPIIKHLKGLHDKKLPFQMAITDGIKYGIRKKGVGYSDFSDKDFILTMLGYYHNNSSKAKEGYFILPILSDSPTMAAVKLPKNKVLKGTREVKGVYDDIVEVARFEWERVHRQSPSGIKNYKPSDVWIFKSMEDLIKAPEFNAAAVKQRVEGIVRGYSANLYNKLKELNILDSDGKPGESWDSGITDVQEFLREFSANHMLNHAQIILMSTGDPAFYKGNTAVANFGDFYKRAKELWSPGTYINKNNSYTAPDGEIWTPCHYNGGKMRIWVQPDSIQKVSSKHYDKIAEIIGEERASAYKDIDVADGQSYIDLVSWKDREVGLQLWTDSQEQVFKILSSGKTIKAADIVSTGKTINKEIKQLEALAVKTPEQAMMLNSLKKIKIPVLTRDQVYKPYVFTHILIDGVLAPFQKKDSEMIISPVYGDKSTPFYNEKYKEYLEGFGYDFSSNSYDLSKRKHEVVTFESTTKVGAGELREIDVSDWRKQQEVPQHHIEEEGRFGTQIMKLIMADIDMLSDYTLPDGDMLTGKEILYEYNSLIIEDIKRSFSELTAGITGATPEETTHNLINILREEVINRGMGDQYLEALEEIELGRSTLPLWHPLHAYRIESLLNSLFKSNVTTQKFNTGFSLVNSSAWGFEKKPELVFEGKKLKAIQAYAPIPNATIASYANKKGIIGEAEMNRIKADIEAGKIPNYLRGICYRIPTENKYSMFNIEIIGFLPTDQGTIILPEEITKIAGLDFDIDKVYGFTYGGSIDTSEEGIEAIMNLKNTLREKVAESKDPETQSRWQLAVDTLSDIKEIREKRFKEEGKLDIREKLQELPLSDKEKEKILTLFDSLSEERFEEINKARYTSGKDSLKSKYPEEFNKLAFIKQAITAYNIATSELADPALGAMEEIEEIAEDIKEIKKNIKEVKNKEQIVFTDEKQASDNRKIDLMRAVLESEQGTAISLDPGGFERLKSNNNQIEKKQAYVSPVDFLDPSSLIAVAYRMNSGKALVGWAATFNASHALWMTAKEPLILAHGFTFDGHTYELLGKKYEGPSELTDFQGSISGNVFVTSKEDLLSGTPFKYGTIEDHVEFKLKTIKENGRIVIERVDPEGEGAILSLTEEGFFFIFGKKKSASKVQYVTRNIAENLAAFVDNGKDPQADRYNMNLYTAETGLAMLSTGVPLETVQYFLTQPGVRKLSSLFFNNGGDFKAKELAKSYVENLAQASIERLPLKNFDLAELKERLKEEPEQQIDIMVAFLKYAHVAQKVGNFMRATRVSDSGVGPSQGNNLAKMFMRESSDFSDDIYGAYAFLDESNYNNQLARSGLYDANDFIVANGKFPNLSTPFFSLLLSTIKEYQGFTPTADQIDDIYREMATFLASGYSFFKNIDAAFMTEVANKLEKVKKVKPENKFLSRLKTREGIVEFRAVTGTDYSEEQEIREAWEDLLVDDTIIIEGREDNLSYKVSDYAKDLIKYTYARTGFRFGFNTFSHLQPVSFYSSLVENGISFNDYLDSSVGAFENSHTVSRFYSQYIDNNFEDLAYVPTVVWNDNLKTVDEVTFKGDAPVFISTGRKKPYAIKGIDSMFDIPYIKIRHKQVWHLFKVSSIPGFYQKVATKSKRNKKMQVMQSYDTERNSVVLTYTKEFKEASDKRISAMNKVDSDMPDTMLNDECNS